MTPDVRRSLIRQMRTRIDVLDGVIASLEDRLRTKREAQRLCAQSLERLEAEEAMTA